MTHKSKILLLGLLVVIVGVAWVAPGDLLTLEQLKAWREQLQGYYADQPELTMLSFVAVYVVVTALSIPGAAVLTMAGGAIFGLGMGLVLNSISATIGATLAFLISRYLLRDWVTQKFPGQLGSINRGIEREGGFYLFALRLVPIFPFFLINLLFGLTTMKTLTYMLVSWAGMLAGAAVYTNAGLQLAQIDSAGDILSADLVGAFILLGLLPLLSRHLVQFLRARRVYKGWRKPEGYDYNLVVIGGGAAGLVAAYAGASMRAKVALIEQDRMGGDCLNTGCVPSKALLHLAGLRAKSARAAELGLATGVSSPRLESMMDHVVEAIESIAPHDSRERYESLGVEVISGSATIVSPWEVSVGDRQLTTRAMVVATGASPWIPPIKGIEDIAYLTTETVWSLSQLPEHLTIIGGGAVGCELAQAFRRLGARVTIIEMASGLMGQADSDVAEAVFETLVADGVEVMTSCVPVSIRSGDAPVLFCNQMGKELALPVDQLLVAVGRRPLLDGLEGEGMELGRDESGSLRSDEYLATAYPNIFAAGDVTSGAQLTHAAGSQGWTAAVNALTQGLWRSRADASVMPQVLYTEPEVATVGATSRQLDAEGVSYEVTKYDLADLDRAITDRSGNGFVKILTAKGNDRILGAAIVAPRAGEMIMEYVLAMKHGLGLRKLLATIRPYPSYADAGKLAAGLWQKEHLPIALLEWLQRFNRFRRG
ncbi:MAG: FAD-dependent oxidoreductase [bacterium]